MTASLRIGTTAAVVAAAAVALVVAVSGGAAGAAHPVGERVGCDDQSGADFPGAYTRRGNLVVGPLALAGGATFTDAATVRRFGGNKFPLLVRAGHTVTVSVPASHRATAGLQYGFHEDGSGRDPIHTVTFSACPAHLSDSSADGPVTFWSGFIVTSAPGCLPLDVWVDDAARRRVRVPLGRRCARPAPKPPLRGCDARAEGGKADDGRPRPAEVAVGPLRFTGLARLASPRELRLDRTSGRYGVKAGVLVPAGVRATLSVAPRARGWAALEYAPHLPGVARDPDGDPVVRFAACAADEPAFSFDGVVGPVTGFSGGFVLTRPGCLPLEVRVPGRPAVRAVVSFGAGRCR
jgi:hypothetical protein